jgi:hypothetical protein
MLLISLLSLAATAQSATNADFVKLKQLLLCDIETESDAVVHWARMSFHDLHLQRRPGLHGCLINPAFLNVPGNAGLEPPTIHLFNLVMEHFPHGTFSFGDVIAFSGKVGFEHVFRGINIPFKFGRSVCNQNEPTLGNANLPAGSIDTMDEMQVNLDYLNLTAQDMAILLAGGHGLDEAKADDSGFRGIFAHVDSGIDYILKTISLKWTPVVTEEGEFQYFNTKFDPEARDGHLRTPADMLFYPSFIPAGHPRDPRARPIEKQMLHYARQPYSVFHGVFAQVYGKMLAIGGGSTPYVDQPLGHFKCPKKKGKGGKGKEGKGGKGGKGKKGKKGKGGKLDDSQSSALSFIQCSAQLSLALIALVSFI